MDECYKLSSLLYDKHSERISRYIGFLKNPKFLHEFIYFESYSTNLREPNKFLSFILSEFNTDNALTRSYIIKLTDGFDNFLNDKRDREIYSYATDKSKIMHINLNTLITKIINGRFNIEYIVRYELAKAKITVFLNKVIGNNNYKFSKSFYIFKNYVKNFDNFESQLKKDLLELVTFVDHFSQIEISRFNFILMDIFGLSSYDLSGMTFNLSTFNNLKIVYNNLNINKQIKSEDYKCLEDLSKFNSVLKRDPIHPTKFVQLKGIKFGIDSSIFINTGFTDILLTNVNDNLKHYILSNCDIEKIKIQIEKIILNGDN